MEILRPTPGDPTVRLSITIPKSVVDLLNELSAQRSVSRSMLITEAVKKGIQK
jgi:metal-responsive CopG/Arc/MetJ family transcriptional regulator